MLLPEHSRSLFPFAKSSGFRITFSRIDFTSRVCSLNQHLGLFFTSIWCDFQSQVPTYSGSATLFAANSLAFKDNQIDLGNVYVHLIKDNKGAINSIGDSFVLAVNGNLL